MHSSRIGVEFELENRIGVNLSRIGVEFESDWGGWIRVGLRFGVDRIRVEFGWIWSHWIRIEFESDWG